MVVPKEAVITRDGKSVVFVVGKTARPILDKSRSGSSRSKAYKSLMGYRWASEVIRLGQCELTDDRALISPLYTASISADSILITNNAG